MTDKTIVTLEQIDITPIDKIRGVIDGSDDLNYLYRVRGLLNARQDLTSTQFDYWDMYLSGKINRIAFDSRTSKYLDDPLGR